jgi:enoyl-CoA hydratase
MDQNGIAVVRLDRPPANALELESARALHGALAQAAREDDARGVVLTGTGEFFSAGLDLKVVPAYDPAHQREMILALTQLVRTIYGFPKPLVAALNGHGVAAGTLLALASDYRVGPDDRSRFGLTGVRVGIPYPTAALAVIEAELAPPARRVILLTAQTFDSRAAHAMGIIDELVPPTTVLEHAISHARDLTAMPADGYRTTKLALRKTTLDTIDRVLRDQDDPFLGAWIPERRRGEPTIGGPL